MSLVGHSKEEFEVSKIKACMKLIQAKLERVAFRFGHLDSQLLPLENESFMLGCIFSIAYVIIGPLMKMSPVRLQEEIMASIIHGHCGLLMLFIHLMVGMQVIQTIDLGVLTCAKVFLNELKLIVQYSYFPGVILMGIPLGIKYARLQLHLEEGMKNKRNTKSKPIQSWMRSAKFGNAYIFINALEASEEYGSLEVDGTSKNPFDEDPTEVLQYWDKLYDYVVSHYTRKQLIGFRSNFAAKRYKHAWGTGLVGVFSTLVTCVGVAQQLNHNIFSQIPFLHLLSILPRHVWAIWIGVSMLYFTVGVLLWYSGYKRQEKYRTWSITVLEYAINFYSDLIEQKDAVTKLK